MMFCKIAYADKNGAGFGSLPYILDGFDNIEDAVREKVRLIHEGYQNVLLFLCPEKFPEEITWDFVKMRLYDEE